MERRFTSHQRPVVAARADGKEKTFAGYAAVFYRAADKGTEYRLWDDMVERIMPGVFDSALRESHDARGLFNHDPSHVLGRVSAKTLRLSVDAIGLRYEIDAPDTQVARDLAVSMERGDVTGSSFAFVARKVAWIEEGKLLIREVHDLELYDVSPVTYPAYDATTADLRAVMGDGMVAVRAEADAFMACRRAIRNQEIWIRNKILSLDIEDSA